MESRTHWWENRSVSVADVVKPSLENTMALHFSDFSQFFYPKYSACNSPFSARYIHALQGAHPKHFFSIKLHMLYCCDIVVYNSIACKNTRSLYCLVTLTTTTAHRYSQTWSHPALCWIEPLMTDPPLVRCRTHKNGNAKLHTIVRLWWLRDRINRLGNVIVSSGSEFLADTRFPQHSATVNQHYGFLTDETYRTYTIHWAPP